VRVPREEGRGAAGEARGMDEEVEAEADAVPMAERVHQCLVPLLHLLVAVQQAFPEDSSVHASLLRLVKRHRALFSELLSRPIQCLRDVQHATLALSVLSNCAGAVLPRPRQLRATKDGWPRASLFDEVLESAAPDLDACVCGLLRRLAPRGSGLPAFASTPRESALAGARDDPHQRGEAARLLAYGQPESEEVLRLGEDVGAWWAADRPCLQGTEAPSPASDARARARLAARRLQQRAIAYCRARSGHVPMPEVVEAGVLLFGVPAPAPAAPASSSALTASGRWGRGSHTVVSAADVSAQSAYTLSDVERTLTSCCAAVGALRALGPRLLERAESERARRAQLADGEGGWSGDGLLPGSRLDALQRVGVAEEEAAALEFIVENGLYLSLVHVQALAGRVQSRQEVERLQQFEMSVRDALEAVDKDPGSFARRTENVLRSVTASL